MSAVGQKPSDVRLSFWRLAHRLAKRLGGRADAWAWDRRLRAATRGRGEQATTGW